MKRLFALVALAFLLAGCAGGGTEGVSGEPNESTYEGCLPSYVLCEQTNLCYNSFELYCEECLKLTPAECACSSFEGVAEDGTFCEIQVIEGEIQQGTCEAGNCIPEVLYTEPGIGEPEE